MILTANLSLGIPTWFDWSPSAPDQQPTVRSIPGRFRSLIATDQRLFALGRTEDSAQPIDGLWDVTSPEISPPFFASAAVNVYRSEYESAYDVVGTTPTRLLFSYEGDIWSSAGPGQSARRLTQPTEYARTGARIGPARVSTTSGLREFRTRFEGSLTGPEGVDVCRGKIRVRATRRGAIVATGSAKSLRPTPEGCRYDLVVDLPLRYRTSPTYSVFAYVETSGAGRISGTLGEQTRLVSKPRG